MAELEAELRALRNAPPRPSAFTIDTQRLIARERMEREMALMAGRLEEQLAAASLLESARGEEVAWSEVLCLELAEARVEGSEVREELRVCRVALAGAEMRCTALAEELAAAHAPRWEEAPADGAPALDDHGAKMAALRAEMHGLRAQRARNKETAWGAHADLHGSNVQLLHENIELVAQVAALRAFVLQIHVQFAGA